MVKNVNPIGGLDQLAKEVEFLEANNPGIMRVRDMGGSLQDFYTNRNLTGAATKGIPTSANTRMEIIPDNINFTEFAPLGSAVELAEMDQGLDQEGILGIDQITADPNKDFYSKLFAEDLYTRTPEDTGLRIDPDLVDKFRSTNPELANRTDAEIMTLFSENFQNVLPPNQVPKKTFGQSIKDFIGSGGIAGNVLKGIGSLFPAQDPRSIAMRNFYGDFGLDGIGRIQSGLMKGYAPGGSGGFLNFITGGRSGAATTFGLQRAYQKRIDTIKNTLKKKESAVLADRLAKLEAEKARELQVLQTAQREKDRQTIEDAYKTQTGDRYKGGENTRAARTTGNYDDPFDPGYAD